MDGAVNLKQQKKPVLPRMKKYAGFYVLFLPVLAFLVVFHYLVVLLQTILLKGIGHYIVMIKLQMKVSQSLLCTQKCHSLTNLQGHIEKLKIWVSLQKWKAIDALSK